MLNIKRKLNPDSTIRDGGLIIFILLFNLSYFFFFRPFAVSDTILKAFYYVILLGSIFYARGFIIGNYKDQFTPFYRGFTIIIILSIFSAVIFWDQSLLDTFLSTIPNFSFLFYFALVKSNSNVKQIEKVIWIFVSIYIVCFYLALYVAPVRIFTGYGELDKEIDTSRGLARIRLTLIGAGPLYYAYFLSISKFKKTSHKKWLFICAFLFLTIVLQLGRQAIFFSFILGLLYFLDSINIGKKIVVVFCFCFGIWAIGTLSPVATALIDKSEQEYSGQKEGDDNIRLAAYKFYLFDVSPNIVTTLIGNGKYSLGKSRYGDFIERYGRDRGFIPADVGYASIYLYFGIIGLLYFLRVLYITLMANVIEEFKYTKYYILFLFLGNFAGSSLLGSVPLFCIAMYVITISKKPEKKRQAYNRSSLSISNPPLTYVQN